jgi:hypothetical protein
MKNENSMRLWLSLECIGREQRVEESIYEFIQCDQFDQHQTQTEV